MDGVQKGDLLTYLVVGWYSDPASDPLHAASQPDTAPECEKRLQSLGWSNDKLKGLPVRFPGKLSATEVSSASSGPDRMDLTRRHPWARRRRSPSAAARPRRWSRLLAPDRTDLNQKDLQRVLCGFQLGQATQVSDDDQLVDLLHRHSFGAVRGGSFWTVDPGYDLQLVSWRDADVPTSANNLVVLGIDNGGLLHIRIFDAGPAPVMNKDESQLRGQAAAIAALKQRIPALLAKQTKGELSDSEKTQVLTEATSIAGQSPAKPPAAPPSANVHQLLALLNGGTGRARSARKEGRVAALAAVRMLGDLGEQTGRAAASTHQKNRGGFSDRFRFGGFE